MPKRSRRSRIWITLTGLMTLLIGGMAWLVILAAQAFANFLEFALAASLAPFAALLEALAYAFSFLIIQEMVVVAIAWATRGPGWALALAGWRIWTWQNP